jgi:hypothetical protein
VHRLVCWILGFRLPGYGDVRDSHHQESRSAEMRNPETQKKAHHSECWILGFRLPGDRDVKDSHHQESRSSEMRKPKTCASLGVLDTGISDTGRWK